MEGVLSQASIPNAITGIGCELPPPSAELPQSGGQSAGEPRRPRGFALQSPERMREIARQGGQAAHALGVAHRFSVEEARRAGRLGGQSIAQDRSHMAEIGRRGRLARRTSAPPP
jgi:general stress protein YciG